MRPPCRPRPITAVCGARRCAGRPGSGAQRVDGAPLFHPRLLPADAEPAAGPLFPCPRRPGRSRHCGDAGAPARRAVGSLADAGRYTTPRDGHRVPGHRGAEWRKRLPRHPRRRGVVVRERPGGPRGLRRAARRAAASWRARDDDLPRPSRLLAARHALLSRRGVARLAQAHPSAARARGGGRGKPRGPRCWPQHVLPPHRGPGHALRRGTGPSGHAGTARST